MQTDSATLQTPSFTIELTVRYRFGKPEVELSPYLGADAHARLRESQMTFLFETLLGTRLGVTETLYLLGEVSCCFPVPNVDARYWSLPLGVGVRLKF